MKCAYPGSHCSFAKTHNIKPTTHRRSRSELELRGHCPIRNADRDLWRKIVAPGDSVRWTGKWQPGAKGLCQRRDEWPEPVMHAADDSSSTPRTAKCQLSTAPPTSTSGRVTHDMNLYARIIRCRPRNPIRRPLDDRASVLLEYHQRCRFQPEC
jgi:hypothetical protein